MLTVVSAVIYAAVVLIAILLIVLVLVQPSKGGGFGSAFGGVGESVFGAQAMGQLSKLTVILLTLFFILTLALAVIAGHKAASNKSLLAAPAQETKVEAPAVKTVSGKVQDAAKDVSLPVKELQKKADSTAKDAAKQTSAPVKELQQKADSTAKDASAKVPEKK